RPVLVGPAPALAVAGLVLALVAEVDQRVDVAVGGGPDAAAAAAVAAVGAALGDELLATERRDPVAAVAGDDLDVRFVDELHSRPLDEKSPAPRGFRAGQASEPLQQSAVRRSRAGRSPYCCNGSMLTVLRCFSPLTAKRTWPSTSANSVWSLPRPTFSPAWKRVPRWRTMIEPALTVWPPKALMPSIFGWESRPFRVEPPPFFCAMFPAPW